MDIPTLKTANLMIPPAVFGLPSRRKAIEKRKIAARIKKLIHLERTIRQIHPAMVVTRVDQDIFEKADGPLPGCLQALKISATEAKAMIAEIRAGMSAAR